MFKSVSLLIVVAGFVALVGCGDEKGAPSASSSAPAAALPGELFVASAPPNPQDVAAAKAAAQSGQLITVRGRIGGSAEPLAPNRAIFTLADISLPTCDKTPMDQCKTPWDSCCEPSDVIAAKSVTVQVAGADGKALKRTLSGTSGLAPGKQIIVVGTAQPAAGGASLVIDAKQIFVVP